MRTQLHKKVLSFSLVLVMIAFTGVSIASLADGEVIPAGTSAPPKASILMEATTGQVLSESGGRTALPIGTLTKLMTTLLAAEAIGAGKLSLDTQITASSHANSATGAVIWLTAGEKMTVENLLKGMIIGNANDASIALAEAVSGDEDSFVAAMNTRAGELGMDSTKFMNCTGADDESQLSSAYDIGLLCAELARHTELYPYMTCWRDSLRDGATELVNANILVKDYKGIIGMKAGFSTMAGNCLALAATREGATYIAVILGGEEKSAMFSSGKALLGNGFSGYRLEELVVLPDELPLLRVKGGVGGGVAVKIEKSSNVVLSNDSKEKITHEITLPEFIAAPVGENQILGEIAFYQGKRLLYKENLVSAGKIDKMTIWRAVKILLKNIVNL